MLKLDKPISLGDETFSHMLFVKGEFDLRVPYVELYPALVRDTGKALLLGSWRLTDAGIEQSYTELLTVIRLAPETDASGTVSPDTEALIVALRTQFLVFLENLEQVVIGLQSEPTRNKLTDLRVALTRFPLSCTFESLAEREIGVEVLDQRTPQPVDEEKV